MSTEKKKATEPKGVSLQVQEDGSVLQNSFDGTGEKPLQSDQEIPWWAKLHIAALANQNGVGELDEDGNIVES